MVKLFYTIGKAANLLGVAVVTLRRWVRNGTLPCIRTQGGHRRFKHDDLFSQKDTGLTLLYARVSSRDQKEDLVRQIETLQTHCASQRWNAPQTLQDIGSAFWEPKRYGIRILNPVYKN